MGIYNVSKHAVVSLTETLYQDLKLVDAPIGVSLLCPYFVPTGIHQSERNRPPHMQNDTAMTNSQKLAQVFSEKAVVAGKVTAAQVDRKSTRLTPVTNAHLVCRLLLEKKNK